MLKRIASIALFRSSFSNHSLFICSAAQSINNVQCLKLSTTVFPSATSENTEDRNLMKTALLNQIEELKSSDDPEEVLQRFLLNLNTIPRKALDDYNLLSALLQLDTAKCLRKGKINQSAVIDMRIEDALLENLDCSIITIEEFELATVFNNFIIHVYRDDPNPIIVGDDDSDQVSSRLVKFARRHLHVTELNPIFGRGFVALFSFVAREGQSTGKLSKSHIRLVRDLGKMAKSSFFEFNGNALVRHVEDFFRNLYKVHSLPENPALLVEILVEFQKELSAYSFPLILEAFVLRFQKYRRISWVILDYMERSPREIITQVLAKEPFERSFCTAFLKLMRKETFEERPERLKPYWTPDKAIEKLSAISDALLDETEEAKFNSATFRKTPPLCFLWLNALTSWGQVFQSYLDRLLERPKHFGGFNRNDFSFKQLMNHYSKMANATPEMRRSLYNFFLENEVHNSDDCKSIIALSSFLAREHEYEMLEDFFDNHLSCDRIKQLGFFPVKSILTIITRDVEFSQMIERIKHNEVISVKEESQNEWLQFLQSEPLLQVYLNWIERLIRHFGIDVSEYMSDFLKPFEESGGNAKLNFVRREIRISMIRMLNRY